MPVELSKQEIHYLGMNIVGKDLEKRGFEFIAIKSDLGSNPQFVCIDKNNQRYFVIVKSYLLPTLFKEMDKDFLTKFKLHALEHDAKILFAGIGIANAKDENLPVYKGEEYLLEYDGIQVIS